MWVWGVVLGSWAVLWLVLRFWYAHRLNRVQHELNVYQKLACVDPLTGIFNRRAYEQHLDKLAGSETSLCLISFDLNGLKAVNDALGHDQGDALLKKTAEILQSFCPGEANAYRVGGDEFLMLAEGLDLNQSGQLVRRLEQAFEAAQVDIACGMAYVSIGRAADFESLRRSSDQAMYQRKQKNKELQNL